jgi:hypothetical protein
MPMSRAVLICGKSIIADNGFIPIGTKSIIADNGLQQIIYDQTHENPDRGRGDKVLLQYFMQRFRGTLTSWKHHFRIVL